MLKQEIRRLFREKRKAITAQQKMKWDDLILIQFQTLSLPFIDTAMSFYAIEENNEVSPFILTDYLHFKNPSLQLAYPKIDKDYPLMKAIVCPADAAFEVNEMGINEPVGNNEIPPEAIDLILVPLLAFDKKGQRVGYGKGYYDRFLKDCREDCIRIGLSYFEPVERIEDAGEFDVPLDLCITPQQVYVF